MATTFHRDDLPQHSRGLSCEVNLLAAINNITYCRQSICRHKSVSRVENNCICLFITCIFGLALRNIFPIIELI